MFADDSKLFFKCTSDSDHQKLLSDVRDVFKWMELNQLKVAVEKCAVLHLGAMNPCRDYATDDNNVIPPVNSIRDIGILMSDDLKFSLHCNSVAQKAFTMINLFFRAFNCRDRDFLRKFFTVYIRPLVENCTTVWNPYLPYSET